MRQHAFFVLVPLVLLGLTSLAYGQSDPGLARQQYKACKDYLAADKPCDALVACEKGLRAMDLDSLRSLTDQARKACVSTKRTERASKRSERTCPDGKVMTSGQCCWPGQSWLVPEGSTVGSCSGMPTSCPAGWTLDAAAMLCSQTPCDAGKVHADETHCCWPDQVWFEQQDRCIGIPACPAGLEASGEACVPVVPDQDQDGLADADDECPTIAEDRDGFEDGDGCPEVDNDGDGVCDALYAASRALQGDAAASFEELDCIGSDGCPAEAEDLDGFEDADGCPDLDNDQDRIADADDLCPDERGVFEHGGCPAPPDYTLTILGWSGVGLGTALLATGAGLMIATIDDRDRLNNPTVSGDRADVVTSISEVEAEELRQTIETRETAAYISFGIGGPLLATGIVLLVLDAVDESDEPAPAMSVGPTADGRGLSMGWSTRW